jgi:putative nucleotidyltransferase with HDIG domain
MKILALTDGSVKSATALDAFDGRTQVDMHVPLAPLPSVMAKPDIVIMSYVDFPEYGMKPLLSWLEKHDLAHKPRILCMPKTVVRQFSASVRLFADKLLPLPVRPEVMLDAVERMDTRLPVIRRRQRNESAATAQSTARKFLSAFSSDNGDASSAVVALSAATKDVCSALEEDGLGSWLDEVKNNHSRTARHCMAVAGFASVWARMLGVKDKDLHVFTRGALLYDIGKMRIPLDLLEKTEPLTPEEEAIIATHPQHGKQILEAASGINPIIVEFAYSHHELLDGSGYPRGLKGKEINDMVHCLTIIDTYVSLTTGKGNRPGMHPNEAYAYMQSIPEKLDKGLVAAFRGVVDMHMQQELAAA